MRFSLVDQPIVAKFPDVAQAGGFVTFEGKVRDNAGVREVQRLEYEAFPEMALREGEALVEEAMERFELLDAMVIHRTGVLEVGETAVVIWTAGRHRREAYAANEWMIDQLKHRVPIWKRETFSEGDSGWIGADASTAAPRDRSMFTRQLRLAEVGEIGQDKLEATRLLLVGVGGLGCASLPYLVGAGIGTIGLVDPDVVQISNLHRQVLFQSQDAGRLKVDRAAVFARRLNPSVLVECYPVRIDESNVDKLVSSFDIVVEGTDSLRTKALVNAACVRHGKPLVVACVHRFEGQLFTVLPGGPCFNCMFPTLPEDGCVGTCAETGVLGVVPGLLGVFQANEVLNLILGSGKVHSQEMLLVDLRSGLSECIGRSKVANCPGCSGLVEVASVPYVIESLAGLQASGTRLRCIDIREVDEEPQLEPLWERRPMSRWHLDRSNQMPTVLICATGIRSGHLARQLWAEGMTNYFSYDGGVERLLRAPR